jgi:hypothetical protein
MRFFTARLVFTATLSTQLMAANPDQPIHFSLVTGKGLHINLSYDIVAYNRVLLKTELKAILK